MFKKTMKFDDLDGNEVEQTFYFNYNKKEIGELIEFGHLLQFPPKDNASTMGLEKMMEMLTTPTSESGLSEQENTLQAYTIFQDLVLNAYGEKGTDNVTFVKNARTREYFESHVAFVELIFEFLGNEKLAAEFIEKCLPAKLVEAAKAEMEREAALKKTPEQISEMVAEADRRQQDPATRIEPGLEGMKAAGLDVDPVVAATAKNIAGATETKRVEDLTEADILAMSDDEFKKLDERQLSKEQLVVAFRRKLAS